MLYEVPGYSSIREPKSHYNHVNVMNSNNTLNTE